ncbi:MAG: hypothetical protein NTV01_05920 [Bacteroidia bacterium]|nr:hypothetical protein [Bacteroidia bacterium]
MCCCDSNDLKDLVKEKYGKIAASEKLGYTNVKFRPGEIENLPVTGEKPSCLCGCKKYPS